MPRSSWGTGGEGGPELAWRRGFPGLLGYGYRRGPDAAQRYWLISLYYPGEQLARDAGAALTTRIAGYKSARNGEPLVGGDIVEQLDPVVRAVDDGAVLTLRLRLAPDRQANFYQSFWNRDVGFLAPGT